MLNEAILIFVAGVLTLSLVGGGGKWATGDGPVELGL